MTQQFLRMPNNTSQMGIVKLVQLTDAVLCMEKKKKNYIG